MAVIAIMAIGQMMVIIAAGIDLSVGSVLALAGIVSTKLMAGGWNIWQSIIAGVFVGIFCGWLNGIMISFGRIPPFIATLGMMGIARGVALILTEGVPSLDFPRNLILSAEEGLPRSFQYRWHLLQLPRCRSLRAHPDPPWPVHVCHRQQC